MKIEFETYKDLTGSYYLSMLKQQHPENINFLSYRRFKVSIELIEEGTDVLIDRLVKMKEYGKYNHTERINKEINRLKNENN